MENIEQVRLLITTLAPILVAVVTGIFLIYQQKQKEEAERNSPLTAEEAKKTGAETAKQITAAAGEIILEYQNIMKSIKCEYDERILKIQLEIALVKTDNLGLKKQNAELVEWYNNLLAQNAVLIAENKKLGEKIDKLEAKILEREKEDALRNKE